MDFFNLGIDGAESGSGLSPAKVRQTVTIDQLIRSQLRTYFVFNVQFFHFSF